ncbi:gamma-tubulin complex component 2-like isoform X1 [Apis cerana]|uniref:gamma-tubulin complex component 2-like isoform X1 n=1 Tax=Apis cerana TaxID=7461 RepID=UPI002B22C4F7|nr:gamma-tubulin complex component 2-like isoform X1 [Apis cerana]XP_061932499.1 gamma-tubulin complex component 2-like isoform X1 [Apis cerana]XP_061932500.1 gamma-tubulin complex component 2-like isoform X1 [Apis cerana]XP_061932501.1 gamma-tubulin complex component 2-like isoform X1 [Apis cerana]XP_061932502.1 gamma-tubulin complex component 2-like isoform X1 [Apis cerana]XP_061932503.1 gamma-tubulin complex component 2-like isoform X1 [Apis cerana]
MSEFKLHHLVVELIGLLGSSSAPEKHVEKLQKEGIPTSASALTIVASQSSVRNLAKNSPVPELFLQKYEELKAKKVDLLGLFIQVLELISEDKELKSYLTKEASALTSISTKNAAITTEDLPQICKNVIKAAVEGEKKLNKQVCAISKKIEPSVIKHNWVHERPRITWDFYNELNVMPCQKVVPIVSQESILLWDILYCLKGIDGIYIVSEPLTSPYAMKTFNISPDVCISYKQLTQQILPLASHYSMTARFVEEKVLPEDGQVNHALREAIKTLLKDYLLFVVQLEMEHVRGKLNLQKLWFYIQPTMIAMTILFQITSTICKANAKGGKVLSLLHEQANNISGEAKFRELCLFLIQAASVPYMQMLEKWVYKGVICDPYEEFFVEDNELIHREELPIDYSADYWEKRYTMRSERTPTFLNEQAQTILRTGKYFNVIRQCGKTVQWGKQEPLIYQQQGQKYITAIDRAYSEAAKTLLEVLIHENDLMGRLRSLKNYFLLAQGDFVVQFMNLCETELNKNMYDIVIHRLASLLEVALRMSTADSDPYKDDLKPELLPYDLQFQMFRILSIQTREEKEYSFQTDKILTGLDAFVFNYDVKWPVSLILNRKAIACYQMLFRHLFYCKYIERRLCRVWVSNKIAKTFTHNVAMSYRQAFSLRQRMLDCIQHLAYYMMVEVIEPNWLTFINKMNKVSNVDDVLSVHQDLQDSYLKECMLTDPDLLGCITGICAACLEFCNFMERMSPYYIDAELTSMIGAYQEDVYDSEDEDGDTSKENAASFEETIISLDEKFTQVLIRLLDRICNLGYDNNNEKLLNVFCRLDFNLFYTDILIKRGREKTIQEDISG